MKSRLLMVSLMVAAGLVSAAPSKQVIQSCLTNESAGTTASYRSYGPESTNEEEDESTGRISRTVKYAGYRIGIWEQGPDAFGMVLNGRQLGVGEVIRTGADKPFPFDTYLAMYGTVRLPNRTYLCVTFNFPGLGQSGTYQNIRGVYLFDVTAKPPRIYYAVGDIRRFKK